MGDREGEQHQKSSHLEHGQCKEKYLDKSLNRESNGRHSHAKEDAGKLGSIQQRITTESLNN